MSTWSHAVQRPALVAACLATTLLGACGHKSSGGNDAPSAAPGAVHTYLTAQPVRNGNAVEFHYAASVDGSTFKCQTDIGSQAGTWQDCPASGLTVQIPAGTPYVFHVKAITPSGAEDASPLVYSDAGTPPAPQQPGTPAAPGTPASPTDPTAPTPAAPIPMQFQIGSYYAFKLPDQMHVTEYSTNKTASGVELFYRIMASADPYYVGNYGCQSTFDQHINIPGNNAGTKLDYCQSTPPEELFKWLMSASIADNHLEVATDAPAVTQENHEIIDINVFDANYEYMQGRSRFEQLCQNQQGNIMLGPPAAFISGDFWGVGPVLANFFMCTTNLVTNAPGLPAMDPSGLWRNSWWVGAFYIAATGQQLPQWECMTKKDETYASTQGGQPTYHHYDPTFCGNFKNPSLLEVTYVSKTPYTSPEDFEQAAWQRFSGQLVQVRPLGTNIAPAPMVTGYVPGAPGTYPPSTTTTTTTTTRTTTPTGASASAGAGVMGVH